MNILKTLLNLLRIKHWIKNVLIFVPAFFDTSKLSTNNLISLVVGFISFSLMASAIYIFNDIQDIEKDKKHTIKRKRPIASGNISIKTAYYIFIILAIISLLTSILFLPNIWPLILLLIYFIINILYSKWLKNIPIIDIVIPVAGFIIRILFGGAIVNVNISNWLYLTTMSASFFMIFEFHKFILYHK